MNERVRHGTGVGAGILIAILVSAHPSMADDIITATATYENVTIVSASWEKVSYRREGISRPQNVDADDIELIRWTREPATLSRGRNNLAAGEFARAVSAFRAASTDANELYALNAAYMLGVAELAWSTQDPSHLSAAVSAFEAYLGKAKGSKHYYVPEATLALAEAQARSGNHDRAASVLSDLIGGGFGSKWVEGAKLKKAEIDLAQGKYAEAREVFREIQGSRNPTFDLEARIGYAACQVGQKQYPAAVESLREVLGEGRRQSNTVPPRYGDLRARAWIVYGQAEEGAAGGDREKLQWAAIRYLRAASVGVAGSETFAEALYRAKQVFEKLGESDRAQAMAQRMNQLCPNSPWTKK